MLHEGDSISANIWTTGAGTHNFSTAAPQGSSATSTVIDFTGLNDSIFVTSGAELSRTAEEKRKEARRVSRARYRASKKDAQVQEQQQLQDLAGHISSLKWSNDSLRLRERALTEVAETQLAHIDILSEDQVALQVQQQLLLGEAMWLMSNVSGQSIHSDEALQWSLHDWILVHFESYLEYLAVRLRAARADPGGPNERQLSAVVNRRREAEDKLMQFSWLHLALLAWNLAHGPAQASILQPTAASWAYTLAGLGLSQQQERNLLAARRSLLQQLERAQHARQQAYAAFGQPAQDNLRQTAGAGMLQRALQIERSACNSFLACVSVDILDCLQEAWLDSCAPTRPWWPDFYAMGNLLAAKRSEPQAPDFTLLLQQPEQVEIAAAMPVLPAFRMMTSPCTSLGAGVHLKRGLLACACLSTGMPSPLGTKYQLPSIQSLQGMTLYEAQAGKYRETWPKPLPTKHESLLYTRS